MYYVYHIIALTLFITACTSDDRVHKKISYDGDQVWRFNVDRDAPKIDTLMSILNPLSMDIWKADRNLVDVRIPRQMISKLSKIMTAEKLFFKVLISDIGKLAESQKKVIDFSSAASDFQFDVYHPYGEIVAYLNALSVENQYVTLSEIGRTSQERQLLMVHVTVQGPLLPPKPAVWFDCGIHAREWISPATCLWGLNFLLSNYGIDPQVTNFLDSYDVYMVPVLNADGYVYSWVADRLWRKNRNQYSGDNCVGIDLNRNYDLGNFGGIGSSNISCTEIYHGPNAFSEKETQAVRDAITGIRSNTSLEAFFSIHSYGQLWMFAYACQPALPAEVDELYRVSQIGVDAVKAINGTVYTNGPHFTTIYPASGTSVDWGYNSGIVQSYITELRDTGEYGFLLPEDQIVPTASEVWQGFIQSILAI